MSGSLQVDPHLRLLIMTATWQRMNAITTEAGEGRIRQFLEHRRKELTFIEAQITGEEARITTCNNAISNLEQLIPMARNVLDAHEENLKALRSLKNRTNDILNLQPKSESTSEALLKEFQTIVVIPESGNDESLETKITKITRELRNLWDKFRHLEMDLEGWRLSRQLSKSALEYLTLTRLSIAKAIEEAKVAFSPLWRIPANIWASIFKLVLQETVSDYVKANDGKTFRPVVYVLSHVCYRWRSLIQGEADLWTVVYAPPSAAWTKDEYNLLTISLEKAKKPITLLTNIYQTFRWGYYPLNRHSRSGNWAQTVTPSDATTFGGREYNLHINTRDDNSSYIQRISNMPLSLATSIVFSATSPISMGCLFSYGSFPSATSLTITNDYPSLLPNLNALSNFPKLTRLTIHVKKLPSSQFDWVGYLPDTLEEVYIRQDISGEFPAVAARIKLSKLHTLGVTPSSSIILNHVNMPGIQTLILYGSSNPEEEVEATPARFAEMKYSRLSHLEFREWGRLGRDNLNAGSVALLGKLIPKTTSLTSIKFTDSFINGDDLVRLIEDVTKGNGEGELKDLKELTLSRVDGITREECDRIGDVVPKLNIYI